MLTFKLRPSLYRTVQKMGVSCNSTNAIKKLKFLNLKKTCQFLV